MITDIPIEVLNDVLSHIPQFDPNQGDLLACCLVNKFFHSIATPALYRNLSLVTNGLGFEEHVVHSLLSKRYKSHSHIRQISINRHREFRREGFIGPYCKERTAIHLAAFIESLPEDQLQSINSHALHILQYIPSTYYSKIKSVECDPRPEERLLKKPIFPSLATLTYSAINHNFSNLGPEWSVLKQYRQQLKSLSLRSSQYEHLNHADIPFPSDPHIEFRNLEHLHLQDMQSIEFGRFSLLRSIPIGNIKRLELIDCFIPPALLVPLAPGFTNLTDLAIYPRFNGVENTYTTSNINDILLKLPSSLQSLRWATYSTLVSDYPSKTAIQRHSRSLRKLWFETSYFGGGRAGSMLEESHYLDENVFKMWEVPIKSELGEILDLDTLSRFPNLEDLALPIETPHSPNSWISSFPKLRSLYLVNSCKIYSSKPRSPTGCFRQEWINWFMSAYNLEQSDKADQPNYPLSAYERHPKLRLIAFQRPAYNWESRHGAGVPQPGSRGFTAHLRDADKSGYFSKEALTSNTVRRLYPEIWEFFKGYHMVENKHYVWPSENTNVAKGVFEDGDEFAGLPESQLPPSHALQDYQMQLMLLEQQNKKRLVLARSEQDILRECPIEAPKPVVVTILPWGMAREPEFDSFEGGYTPPFNPLHSGGGENPDPLSAPPKSLQEYQNDFLSFDEQSKKRQEYVNAHMEKLTA
ncbi:hypothetical protein TWF706_004828 [Orbilia oligospora]|nr:hypothetical protein TWF706_004828 [Orbilia oligospora]KAF3103789.1 hypothetical protein TWF706_004828 [Orbilia oligospora]